MTKSSPSIWQYVVTVKISSIFVAFLENTNFLSSKVFKVYTVISLCWVNPIFFTYTIYVCVKSRFGVLKYFKKDWSMRISLLEILLLSLPRGLKSKPSFRHAESSLDKFLSFRLWETDLSLPTIQVWGASIRHKNSPNF